MKTTLLAFAFVLAAVLSAPAQQRVGPVDDHAATSAAPMPQLPTPAPLPHTAGSDYILGPRDQISVIVPDLPDQFTSDQTYRIDMSGDVNLPLAGRIHAAGLTTQGLEQQIEKSLKKILKEPEAVVGIVNFGSEPVSILGEVNNPGVHQVAGGTDLLAALSSAGGFTESVGNTVTITRSMKNGEIPLPDAHFDQSGQYSIATVSVRDILRSLNPAENISVMADDIISVSKAEVVYAVGSLTKPGGFMLGENQGLSALQVLSLSEGLTKEAAPQKAMILRLAEGSKQRSEIPVNLKALLQGSDPDVPLQPGDILFVPTSKTKVVSGRVLQAAVTLTTGMIIYGKY